MRTLFGFRSQHAKDKVLAVIMHTIPWYLAFQTKQQIHNNNKKYNQSTESTERWHLRFNLTTELQYRYINFQ